MLTSIYQVSFNGNRLDLIPGVDLYNHDFTRLPDRDIKVNKLARRSLSIITSSEYTQKTIPVYMDVCSGNRQDTEATVTRIKSILQGQNGDLRVLQSGYEVKYTATVNEFSIEWEGNKAYCVIGFLASTPIGKSTTLVTAVGLSGVTASTNDSSFSVQGSYDVEPIITITVNSVTGGTGETITLLNASTQQGISITADFVDGDILIVNSETLKSTINGAYVDFAGLYPVFQSAVQAFSYSDTFTARNVDILVEYAPRFI